MLYPYTKDGEYGRFFEGKATVSFTKSLSVIEFEELKNRKDLQKVVVQILMIQITNQMLGEKRQLFQIIMDEAWDLLRGKETGEFMEGLARKIRKYKGALMPASQSLMDFMDLDGTKPGAQAVYDNSAFVCIMQQKNETIAALKNSGKFPMTAAEEEVLRSIKTQKGEYSEICIKGADGMAIGRLRLDSFSLLLFSTDADDVNDINVKLKQGMSTEEAIESVLQDRGVSNV